MSGEAPGGEGKACHGCGGLGWIPAGDEQLGCIDCNGTGHAPAPPPRPAQDAVREAALTVYCDVCESDRREPCHSTVTGDMALYPHPERLAAARGALAVAIKQAEEALRVAPILYREALGDLLDAAQKEPR